MSLLVTRHASAMIRNDADLRLVTLDEAAESFLTNHGDIATEVLESLIPEVPDHDEAIRALQSAHALAMAEQAPCAKAIRLVREAVRGEQTMSSLVAAAHRVIAAHPDIVADVLDEVGCYPSSFPELHAIQHARDAARPPYSAAFWLARKGL